MIMIDNATKLKDRIVEWIRNYFADNGSECVAVIGISGGKDSSIVAALCVEALGRDRVLGVLMPNGAQKDIDSAQNLVECLNIKSITVNIKDAVSGVIDNISLPKLSDSTLINLPARIRMSVLYAVAQTVNGRVANTCNLSENWVGYSTRYGDAAGDFSPLSLLTATEVKEIGHALNLPVSLVEKVPSDGLTDKTDEDNLGFSYDMLDRYIRYGAGTCHPEIAEKIDELHDRNKFKLEPIPVFNPNRNLNIRKGGSDIEWND